MRQTETSSSGIRRVIPDQISNIVTHFNGAKPNEDIYDFLNTPQRIGTSTLAMSAARNTLSPYVSSACTSLIGEGINPQDGYRIQNVRRHRTTAENNPNIFRHFESDPNLLVINPDVSRLHFERHIANFTMLLQLTTAGATAMATGDATKFVAVVDELMKPMDKSGKRSIVSKFTGTRLGNNIREALKAHYGDPEDYIPYLRPIIDEYPGLRIFLAATAAQTALACDIGKMLEQESNRLPESAKEALFSFIGPAQQAGKKVDDSRASHYAALERVRTIEASLQFASSEPDHRSGSERAGHIKEYAEAIQQLTSAFVASIQSETSLNILEKSVYDTGQMFGAQIFALAKELYGLWEDKCGLVSGMYKAKGNLITACAMAPIHVERQLIKAQTDRMASVITTELIAAITALNGNIPLLRGGVEITPQSVANLSSDNRNIVISRLAGEVEAGALKASVDSARIQGQIEARNATAAQANEIIFQRR